MGIFKGLFGGGDKEDAAPRSLVHPKDLQINDLVKFGFAAQTGISAGDFKVTEVNTYHFSADKEPATIFTLDGAEGLFFLSLREESGNTLLELGKVVLPEQIEQIFPWEQFVDIIEPDTGSQHTLERLTEAAPDEFAGWTAQQYCQEAGDGDEAYFHAGDYRGRNLPEDKDACEPFDYYLMVSPDRLHALRIMVFDGGRSEAILLAYVPLNKLEEMWPASNN
ncbi:MAG: hypothetical protein GXP08_15600 [Gammaproteobacteria bacterium]|nr:hypothetical protein [Gammaproteobacteria bacterium]